MEETGDRRGGGAGEMIVLICRVLAIIGVLLLMGLMFALCG